MEKTIHQGRNVRRFREMMGLKQEALATELGDEWNQRKISLLEQKEAIEEPLLLQVATVLKVPVEAIKNFDEEAAIAYFNTFENGSINNGHFSPNFNNCTFNPLDKIVDLYERMLKEKDDLIQKLMK
ncbi:helix-turn-helix transcriptional regulator [Niabella insulamsoli]|uniref:helix-turn-helix transcriptional regulator n=1 Tax=Niabella insulamsoli TaxID=3144874 RepID=UPI0031FC68C3